MLSRVIHHILSVRHHQTESSYFFLFMFCSILVSFCRSLIIVLFFAITAKESQIFAKSSHCIWILLIASVLHSVCLARLSDFDIKVCLGGVNFPESNQLGGTCFQT
jgi:hypothetical protein